MVQGIRGALTGGLAASLILTATASQALGFAYITAGEGSGPYGENSITHPLGYTGFGGVLDISVGIAEDSPNANAMQVSTQNVVTVWNQLLPTTGNLDLSTIAGNEIDFESTLLHELGHSLGLAHPNAATESGLPKDDRNYTKSTNGANNTFDLNAGADTVKGSADDLRGDDGNLHWYHIGTNDPFCTCNALGVVDKTTFSRDLDDLPDGDLFAANADRDVAELNRYDVPNTEAVMQQGAFFGEVQRTLGANDVAGLKFAMAGLDETAGTADDYIINLIYAGLDDGADIVIDFDNVASFASSSSSTTLIFSPGSDFEHTRITSTSISFNTGYNWYFNDTLLVIPEPGSLILLAAGCGLIVSRSRRTGR